MCEAMCVLTFDVYSVAARSPRVPFVVVPLLCAGVMVVAAAPDLPLLVTVCVVMVVVLLHGPCLMTPVVAPDLPVVLVSLSRGVRSRLWMCGHGVCGRVMYVLCTFADRLFYMLLLRCCVVWFWWLWLLLHLPVLPPLWLVG